MLPGPVEHGAGSQPWPLKGFFAVLGPVFVRVSERTLQNRAADLEERVGATGMLIAVGMARPELRAQCVRTLAGALAPEATENPEDEWVAGFAVRALLALHAHEALPDVRAAFERDAVCPGVVEVSLVAKAFGPEAAAGLPVQPQNGLVLHCNACGRVRRHAVRQCVLVTNLVMPLDGPTAARPERPRYPASIRAAEREALDRTWSEVAEAAERAEALRYGPFLMPAPVRCPHCLAENRYAACEGTLADLERAKQAGTVSAGASVTSGLGEAHPVVVALRYGRIADAHPERPDWRLRQGRALRMAGRWAEAAAAFAAVLAGGQAAPSDLRLEAALTLALLAGALGNTAAARQAAHQGIALAQGNAQGEPDAEDAIEALTKLLESLSSEQDGSVATLRAQWSEHLVRWAGLDTEALPRSAAAVQGPRTRRRSPGRNDPCPCGSGRKYKRCCGA